MLPTIKAAAAEHGHHSLVTPQKGIH